MQGMNDQKQTPPPPPQVQYSISVNGQQVVLLDGNNYSRWFKVGQLTKDTHVWKQGMVNWELAGNVQG